MTLKFIGKDSVPSFIALSTDITANKITGASLTGKLVLTTDDGEWYIIKEDQTLSPYAIPATFSGTISFGTINIGQSIPGTTNAVAIQYFNGAGYESIRTPNVFTDLSFVNITTIATVWTPAAGKKFRLMGGTISVSAACSVLFEDNVSGATIFRTPILLTITPYSFTLGNGVLSGTADNVLKATSSTGIVSLVGTLYGTEE